MNNQNTPQEENPNVIARWMLFLHRYFIRNPLRNKEILPPGSAPIYTHSFEYIAKYKQQIKKYNMESNTIKTNYYDKVNSCREVFSDDWFGFILTMIMDVVSDSGLSKDDTIELMEFLTEEIKN